MENKLSGHKISKPQIIRPPVDAQPAPTHPLPNNGSRPLSDIRELSEPTVYDPIVQRSGNTLHPNHNTSRADTSRYRSVAKETSRSRSADNSPSSYSSTPERSSAYSVPHSIVPRRSSSQNHAQQPTRIHTRKPSIRIAPPPSQPKFEGFIVPNRGQSHSPVKEAGSRLDAVKSESARRIPSRTHIRTPQSTEILEFPTYRHPRVKLDLQVTAPLFVGGGSIEGHVKVTVDENERIRSRRSLGMGGLSVDLVGFEETSGARKAAFLAVGTEMIDTNHPPPPRMAGPPNPLTPDEKFWTLEPSTSSLPFMISLPLDTGPPPFQSKNAGIRFLLCATALIRDAGKHYRVRTSQNVSVIATYDPEKALTSLPSPLTATDELTLRRFGRCENVKLTAGLHRQVWVSASSIFVDIHIANKCHKPVKRLELSLERDILCYKHAPAATREKSASQARIFESNEQSMITRTVLKEGLQGWNGVEPQSSETRTCELELPRGHATVRCGKYFEVRFFLNVTASLSNSKLVSVQLPITLIHMNSLDVLPNSVAQVAAAIEEKRVQAQHQRSKPKQHGQVHSRQRSTSSPAALADLRRRPSYSQGRAFAAPRQQSIDRQKAARADVADLREAVDSSPRKFHPQLHGTAIKKMGSKISIGAISLGNSNSTAVNPFSDMAYQTPPLGRRKSNYHVKAEENIGSAHDGLRPMRSVDTLGSKKSASTTTSEQVAEHSRKPRYNFTIVQHRIEPHALGLSTSRRQSTSDDNSGAEPLSRPGTGLSFRERMDRSRYEVKGVRRKASGSVKERGVQWWEQVKNRSKEREGWI